jgi:hypothetical protein
MKTDRIWIRDSLGTFRTLAAFVAVWARTTAIVTTGRPPRAAVMLREILSEFFQFRFAQFTVVVRVKFHGVIDHPVRVGARRTAVTTLS